MSFNGGTITNPIEINRTFLNMESAGNPTVRTWMYADNPNLPAYIDASSPGIGLRFSMAGGNNKPDGLFTDLFPVKLGSDGRAIAVNHHLFVRKDFQARGMIDSREGILVLHGNGKNAAFGNDRWNIGWGPRAGGAPFIWLAQGGDRVHDDTMGGNPAAETLLIVTNNQGDPAKPGYNPPPPELPGYAYGKPNSGAYKWGHIEAGDFTSHGFVKTSHLTSQSSANTNNIAVHSNLLPYNLSQPPNNQTQTYNLGSPDFKFENLYTKKIDATGLVHGGGGSGDAFIVGDDLYLVDINIDGRMSLQGRIDRTKAGIQFGSNGPYIYKDSSVMRVGTNWVVDGYLAVSSLQSGTNLGPLYRNGSGQISYNTSSERYKEHIVAAEDCSWIYALRPVTFDWKDDKRAKTEGTQLGLIAEEVHKIYPQLTWSDSDGKPEGVHYEWLGVPLLVELKKLRKEVDELKAKLAIKN